MWQSFVSWLVGIDRGEIAGGTGVRLKLANPWPTWVILLFAVAAVWLVFFLYRREKGTASAARKVALAVVRCLLLALIVFVLFKPILAVDKSELKQAYVVVLLDDSLSMRTQDRYQDEEVRLALAQAVGVADEGATRLSAAQSAELGELTRAELVNRAIARRAVAFLSRVERGSRLRLAHFAEDLRGAAADAWKPTDGEAVRTLIVPSGSRTLLGKALRQAAESLRGHRIAAMVVVTDGRTQDTDPTAAETAKRLAILHGEPFPVFTVGVGSLERGRDVEVVKILAPTAVKKDDKVTFNAVVTSQGVEGDIEVQLHRDDQLVKTETVRLRAIDGPQTVPITYTPETKGSFRFRITFPPQPDELNTENNHAVHVLTVKDEKTRVLFVAGQPSYFYRYLKNALLVDASVELSCLLQSADADFHQEGNVRITHYPDERPELFEYDVIVFHDVDPSVFRTQNLADVRAFVGQFGGGFIYVAGPSHPVGLWTGTPLEEMLPVALGDGGRVADPLAGGSLKEGFQLRLTEQGRRHGITQLADRQTESLELWSGLPGCYWYQPVARAKPGAVVLAEHPYDRDERGAMPLLVVGRYDPGRTLFCGLDGTWRWRFWVGDVLFNRFWVQAINYVGTYRILGGSRRVQLAADRRTYDLGERVVLQAQVLDEAYRPAQSEALEAKVEMQGSAPETVRLARSRHGAAIFEGSFEATRPGSGVVTLGVGADQDSLSFTVRLPETEFRDPTMDAATLRAIASATRGTFLRLHEIDQLDGLIEAAGREITTEVQDPVYDAPIVVILFLGLVCTEWWFRKRAMLA